MDHRAAAAGGVGRLAGTTILLVEDEPDLRELLADSLSHHGARVCEAGSAEDALAALDAIQADALVSDIGLPGIDGLELIRLLRSRGAERGGTVPAVALTGYARDEDKLQVLEAGYHVHVSKPVDGARLIDALVRLLRDHSVR